jgi:hypothetical protein
MKLIHEATGNEVVDGETVTDFRGDKAVVTGREEPRHSGSTGRVYVRANGWTNGFYPSVFDMKWIEA